MNTYIRFVIVNMSNGNYMLGYNRCVNHLIDATLYTCFDDCEKALNRLIKKGYDVKGYKVELQVLSILKYL